MRMLTNNYVMQYRKINRNVIFSENNDKIDLGESLLLFAGVG